MTDGTLREMLPRLFELRDLATERAVEGHYFESFAENLESGVSRLRVYKVQERRLAALDDAAWADIKRRVMTRMAHQIAGRGWQSLFDLFGEARAYCYLMNAGCSDVRFVPAATTRTPDLQAMRDGRRLWCEVKTLNISSQEAGRRAATYAGEIKAFDVMTRLPAPFFVKLRGAFSTAVQQLDAVDPERLADRVAFLIVNFDDCLGDYMSDYFAQIDEDLMRDPIEGAALVLSPDTNLFERRFAMQTATVYTD